MITEERWLPVVGYEGLYEVSDHGRVRSLDRVARSGKGWFTYKGRMLKIQMSATGYMRVGLSRDCETIKFQVHRLVAIAFLPFTDQSRTQVAHRDNDRTNNHLSNLRHATPQENTNDRVEHGTVLNGVKNHNSKLNDKLVMLARFLHSGCMSYAAIGRLLGVTKATAKKACDHDSWAHVGPCAITFDALLEELGIETA